MGISDDDNFGTQIDGSSERGHIPNPGDRMRPTVLFALTVLLIMLVATPAMSQIRAGDCQTNSALRQWESASRPGEVTYRINTGSFNRWTALNSASAQTAITYAADVWNTQSSGRFVSEGSVAGFGATELSPWAADCQAHGIDYTLVSLVPSHFSGGGYTRHLDACVDPNTGAPQSLQVQFARESRTRGGGLTIPWYDGPPRDGFQYVDLIAYALREFGAMMGLAQPTNRFLFDSVWSYERRELFEYELFCVEHLFGGRQSAGFRTAFVSPGRTANGVLEPPRLGAEQPIHPADHRAERVGPGLNFLSQGTQVRREALVLGMPGPRWILDFQSIHPMAPALEPADFGPVAGLWREEPSLVNVFIATSYRSTTSVRGVHLAHNLSFEALEVGPGGGLNSTQGNLRYCTRMAPWSSTEEGLRCLRDDSYVQTFRRATMAYDPRSERTITAWPHQATSYGPPDASDPGDHAVRSAPGVGGSRAQWTASGCAFGADSSGRPSGFDGARDRVCGCQHRVQLCPRVHQSRGPLLPYPRPAIPGRPRWAAIRDRVRPGRRVLQPDHVRPDRSVDVRHRRGAGAILDRSARSVGRAAPQRVHVDRWRELVFDAGPGPPNCLGAPGDLDLDRGRTILFAYVRLATGGGGGGGE